MPNKPRQFSVTTKDKEPSGEASHNWHHIKSRHERGYDTDWVKLRESYIEEHYLCELCLEVDRTSPAKIVDHRIPFKGKDDPLRLDRNNLQSLCIKCNNMKTSREGNAARRIKSAAN